MPSRTSRPRAISPVTRSPTRTRASDTRCTTARTSVLDLDQAGGGPFIFETKGHGVSQLAAGIEPEIEQVPRHHVAERLEHRLLDAGMLAFEVEDQPLDALPLQ